MTDIFIHKSKTVNDKVKTQDSGHVALQPAPHAPFTHLEDPIFLTENSGNFIFLRL